MKIKTIRYKRLLNLGNYENETLELEAEVDIDSENEKLIQDSITQLRVQAYTNLSEKVDSKVLAQALEEKPF